jgi:hypothetical protein
MAFGRILWVRWAGFYPVDYVDCQDQNFKRTGEKLESREDHFHIPPFFEDVEADSPRLALEK